MDTNIKTSLGTNIAAMLVILIIVATVGLRLWSSNEALKINGPYLITQDSHENVYIMLNNSVFISDKFGKLNKTLPLEKFEITGFITDFLVLDNGNLLFGNADSGEILNCNQMDFKCKIIAGGQNNNFKPADAFKMEVDELRNRLYVADTSNHQIYVFDLAGEKIKIISGNHFKYPNTITLNGNLLYIADTNHHRIAVYDTEEDSFSLTGKSFKAKSSLTRSGRIWPTFVLYLPNSEKWVINSNGLLQKGDLVLFDDQDLAKKSLEFGENANPDELLLLDDIVLIADSGDFKIRQISLDGKKLNNFGSQGINAELEKLKIKKLYYQDIETNSLGLLFIAFFLVIYIAINQKKNMPSKQTTEVRIDNVTHKIENSTPQILSKKIIWVEPNLALFKKIKLAGLGTVAMAVLSTGLFSYVLITSEKDIAAESLHEILLVGGGLSLVISLLFYLAYINSKTRVGADDKYIYIKDHTGRMERAMPDKVLYTSRVISTGWLATIIGNKNQSHHIYPWDELESVILSRLKNTAPINGLKMTRHLVSVGNSHILTTITLGFLGLLLVGLVEYMKLSS